MSSDTSTAAPMSVNGSALVIDLVLVMATTARDELTNTKRRLPLLVLTFLQCAERRCTARLRRGAPVSRTVQKCLPTRSRCSHWKVLIVLRFSCSSFTLFDHQIFKVRLHILARMETTIFRPHLQLGPVPDLQRVQSSGLPSHMIWQLCNPECKFVASLDTADFTNVVSHCPEINCSTPAKRLVHVSNVSVVIS